jgi:long-subunit fatty acid transport protein
VDIKHEFFGAMVHLTENDVLGASLTALHMADMEVTTETQPFGTGTSFAFGDVAVSLSYARKMTDQFSFGATVRYIEETMDVLKMRALTFDLGTFYWTGLGTTRFAVVISNFGGDVAPEGSVTGIDQRVTTAFQSFSVPTLFRLGFAFDPVLTDQHRLTGAFQLDHPNDNAENFRLGLEYGWNETFFVRAGVKRTLRQSLLGEDQTTAESYSLGTGVRVPLGFASVQADYAYSDFAQLGSIHRMTLLCTF